MKIKIGGTFGEPEQIIDALSIDFISDDDGRPLFHIYPGKDGVSIEVSAGVAFKHCGKVYDNRFSVHPNASNSVTLRAVEYKP